MEFLQRIGQIILGFVQNLKIPRIARGILQKKTRAGGITMPDFRLYYKAVVMKTLCYWHKIRHIDQWSRIENPEVDPQLYGQLVFDKGGETIHWKKDSLFNKRCWENWTASHVQKGTRPLSYTTHNDKLKMDERSKCETRFHQNPRGEHRQHLLNLATATSCKIHL